MSAHHCTHSMCETKAEKEFIIKAIIMKSENTVLLLNWINIKYHIASIGYTGKQTCFPFITKVTVANGRWLLINKHFYLVSILLKDFDLQS